MSLDTAQGTTELSGERSQSDIEISTGRTLPVPALTILYHPRLRRMGDRVLLDELRVAGREVHLARFAPRFAPPRQHRGEPLAEKRISREPLRLCRAPDGGIEIFRDRSRTQVAIDGVALGERFHVTEDALRRGALINLSGCVLLLLHEHTVIEEREPDDLGLVGESTAMVQMRADIRRVAELDATVLIRGQTGTGKELVAQAIHRLSPRQGREMVSINMSTIPATVAAAELFGTARGAFTDATEQEGHFGRAHASTLFLDEIGEMPMDVQAMLLRALDTKEIIGLGGKRRRVNVRVLAATDADLDHRMAVRQFNEPLFYRLNDFEIELPPLRERRDDIGRLLFYFLGIELRAIGETERLDQLAPTPWLPMSLVSRLAAHDWPGNVRELRNAVRKLVIASRGRTVAELPATLVRRMEVRMRDRNDDNQAEPAMAEVRGGAGGEGPYRPWRRVADITDQEILDAIRANDGDKKAAARKLDISRTTLYKRIDASELLRGALGPDLDE